MGILNVTKDSFFDGGVYSSTDLAMQQAKKMIDEGVNIIDVGGASSRPGADEVSLEEELKRVIPVIEMLSKKFLNIPISIDTNKAEVARQAVHIGASIVNDISAGDDDKHMLETVSKLRVPFVAMHKKGSPKTMQKNPQYEDVVQEVLDYFIQKVDECRKHGIIDLIIDPGFGFGKTVEHNYLLLKHLNVFSEVLNVPILAGLSRKSMINKVLNTTPNESLNGTTALNMVALLNGANILRVHDVKEARQVVQLFEKLKNS
ncbi:MAG: dihydropteroate synthase [Flavobacteriales bacterium]|nr:dihydropteroate synthase [Flavobacteriales bacterium]